MYVIDNPVSGFIEARNIETLAEAVIRAARYDGWGAEFVRGDDGRMGLRTSNRHIGNNQWAASGQETAAYGCTSDLDDDDMAIEAVSKAIVNCRFGGNMESLELRDQADFVKGRLQFALDEFEGDKGPGNWLLAEAILDGKHEGCALLSYKWPDGMTGSHPQWGDSDAPWKKWGGDGIVAAAQCKIRDGFSIDGIDHAVVELNLREA